MLNSVSLVWAVEMVAKSINIMNAWRFLFVVFCIIMAVCFVGFDGLFEQRYDFFCYFVILLFWFFGYFVGSNDYL